MLILLVRSDEVLLKPTRVQRNTVHSAKRYLILKLAIIQFLPSEMICQSYHRRKGIKLSRDRNKVLRCGPQVNTCLQSREVSTHPQFTYYLENKELNLMVGILGTNSCQQVYFSAYPLQAPLPLWGSLPADFSFLCMWGCKFSRNQTRSLNR